jgi:arylsulfatase A-like enzyme
MRTMLVSLVALLSAAALAPAAEPAGKPNIIFILADDLGYGDLGCYGQKRIKTPHIDRLAAEGLRFTQVYAGSTVCAPSRCVLMTGLHTGRCRIRGNARVPLQPADVAVAEVLKQAGYATGIVGKWGLGEPDSTGIPNAQGFDEWFGYLNQHHAHNYWPDYLWRNRQRVEFPNVVNGNVASKREVYSHDLFTKEALAFVERHKGRSFFLYLAYTIPHANNEAKNLGMEVPDDAPYTAEDWPQQERNFAAMITRMDRDIGSLVALLGKLGIDKDTYIVFSSDNGAHREGGHDPKFFNSSGPLRGIKRDLYEGGIRVPTIVRRPGTVPAGVSDAVWAFWDFLPTAAELAGVKPPAGLDGVSVVDVLHGRQQPALEDRFLYWEFHEGGFKQAARRGKWKAVRPKPGGPLELFDLSSDLGETRNLAAAQAEVIGRFEQFLKTARTDSPDWPVRPGKN